jgi:hypothetical protein
VAALDTSPRAVFCIKRRYAERGLRGVRHDVLSRAGLRGRHGDEAALVGAINAYQIRRNDAKATINWRFSTQDARSKLHRLYPCNS